MSAPYLPNTRIPLAYSKYCWRRVVMTDCSEHPTRMHQGCLSTPSPPNSWQARFRAGSASPTRRSLGAGSDYAPVKVATRSSSISFPPAATILFSDLNVSTALRGQACCPNSFRRSCSRPFAGDWPPILRERSRHKYWQLYSRSARIVRATGAEADLDHGAITKSDGRQPVVKNRQREVHWATGEPDGCRSTIPG